MVQSLYGNTRLLQLLLQGPVNLAAVSAQTALDTAILPCSCSTPNLSDHLPGGGNSKPVFLHPCVLLHQGAQEAGQAPAEPGGARPPPPGPSSPGSPLQTRPSLAVPEPRGWPGSSAAPRHRGMPPAPTRRARHTQRSHALPASSPPRCCPPALRLCRG